LKTHRRLADGIVHCASSATYEIFFRLPNPIPNPKPITDPNPNRKINQKQNTGLKLNIELYLKVDFVGMGVGL